MGRLAFTHAGNGPPLVLLHGIGLSRRAWDPVVPALAEHFDVLAIDLPGFGESEPMPPQVEPTPAALAASVANLLDDLGISAPHIVGNSLGGWVALEFEFRPCRIQRLLDADCSCRVERSAILPLFKIFCSQALSRWEWYNRSSLAVW